MDRRFCVSALAAAGVSGCAEQEGSRVQVEPRADAALRKMSTTLSNAQSFSFHSVTTIDEPVETGHLAHFSRSSQIVVHRSRPGSKAQFV